jgi:hypothetical protein
MQDLNAAHEAYIKSVWVTSGGNPKTPAADRLIGFDMYNLSFAKAKRQDVVVGFHEAESQTRWDALR